MGFRDRFAASGLRPPAAAAGALGFFVMVGFAGVAAGCRDSQAAPLHQEGAEPPAKASGGAAKGDSKEASPKGDVLGVAKDEGSETPADAKAGVANKDAPAASPDGTLTLSAVGDCTLGSDYRVKGAEGTFDAAMKAWNDDSSVPFSGVREVLSKDDLTIANLEGPLSRSKPAVNHTFVFNGKPEYAEALAKGSVEMVNLANNHAGDFGPDGMKQTIEAVEDAGVGSFGNGRVDVRTVKGIEVVNMGYLGGGKGTREQVVKDVKQHKRPDNLVIVTFHWGVEGLNVPTDDQRTMAHAVIDAGADLILGHHPHVLQGIETYKGHHIVYSLGNFVFGGHSNPADKDSMIYQEVFAKEGGVVVTKENRMLPVRISSVTTHNDFRPVLLDGEDKARVLTKVAGFSELLVPKKR